MSYPVLGEFNNVTQLVKKPVGLLVPLALLIGAAGFVGGCSEHIVASKDDSSCEPGTRDVNGVCVDNDNQQQADSEPIGFIGNDTGNATNGGEPGETNTGGEVGEIDTSEETGGTGTGGETGEIDTSEETGGTGNGADPLGVNDALLLDNDLPSKTPCGKPNGSGIIMRNTGTSTWTNEAGFKLGTVGGSDALYPAGDYILLPPGASVPPNGEWEFEFDIQAPAEPGVYLSDWQMFQDEVGGFGDVVIRNIEVYCPGECPCSGGTECVDGKCVCGPSPDYQMKDGQCLPSCGAASGANEWSNATCCSSGCGAGVGDAATWDCDYCCEGANSCSDSSPPSPPHPPDNEIDCSDADKDSILESAIYVRNNFPQYFDIEDMDDFLKRQEAYKMMTVVINDLRNKGVNASRCIANPGLPESDPFLWCSDALVCGSPGKANTIDIYQSWSFPATPQVHITETGSSGVVTADLVSLK